MTNEFQGNLYNTRNDMLEAIAYEFMTAGGLNTSEQITDLLDDASDLGWATEAVIEWDLGDVTASELAEYIAAFRATRPDTTE